MIRMSAFVWVSEDDLRLMLRDLLRDSQSDCSEIEARLLVPEVQATSGLPGSNLLRETSQLIPELSPGDIRQDSRNRACGCPLRLAERHLSHE